MRQRTRLQSWLSAKETKRFCVAGRPSKPSLPGRSRPRGRSSNSRFPPKNVNALYKNKLLRFVLQLKKSQKPFGNGEGKQKTLTNEDWRCSLRGITLNQTSHY